MLVQIPDVDVIGAGHRIDGVHPGADEPDPLLVPGPPVIFFEFFAVGAHIHEENRRIQGHFAVLLGDDRFFDGIHAAHRRAIAVVAVIHIPGTDALEPGDLGGFLVVRRPHHVAREGSGRGQDPLEFHPGDDIGELGVIIGAVAAGIVGLKAGRQDDRADVDILVHIHLRKIHRPGGTEFFTGLALAAFFEIDAGLFIDGILGGHRLGITQVSRLTLGQAHVVFVGHFLRAFLGAETAGDALLHVDIARHLAHLDREIPRLAADPDDLRRSHDLDVNVPADLDQLGRDNSHGAVIGGKGLVQLRHDPTNGGFGLHHVNEVSGIGQIQSGLHPGDTAADHHHCANRLISLLFRAHKGSPVISVVNYTS